MPNAVFNAQIPEQVLATIGQLEGRCTYASGVMVHYVNGGKQLRVKLRDATKKVLLTVVFQPANNKFFCRAYAYPNKIIDAGVDRLRVTTPAQDTEPLRSEFHCTAEEFMAGIFDIVDFSYAQFQMLA